MPPPDTAPSLSSITMMLVVDQTFALEVLETVVRGFAVGKILRARTVEEALKVFEFVPADVVVVDCSVELGGNVNVAHRLRRELPPAHRATPIIVLAAHAGERHVKQCVAAGASFVICKPYNSETLLRRMTWLSSDPRAFIIQGEYIGPDRRVRNRGIPVEVGDGRRATDLPADVGAAGENLDQDVIDSLFKPQKVALE